MFSLETEIICGYKVSAEMKALWAIELDLLEKFIDVCNRYELEWWVSGGSLLGAVRHKGFIPWDDDIDVCMPRKDFDILQSIARKEFTGRYFFQTGFVEEDAYRINAKIRNTETDGYVEYEKYCNITKGVFIDVFPLDNIPDSKIAAFMQMMKLSLLYPVHRYRFHPETSDKGPFVTRLLSKAYRMLIGRRSLKECLERMNSAAVKYENNPCRRWGMITFMPRDKRLQWDKEWFGKTIELPFENLTVKAPENYDTVLKQQYGDYMKIPEKIESGYHGSMIYKKDNEERE